MSFLWPSLLWLLIAVPLLVAGYLYLLRRRNKLAVRYASTAIVKEAIGAGQKFRRHVPPTLFLGAMLAMLVAIARPSAVITLPSMSQTIILAVDVSGSMRATDVEPNRISAAQAAAKAFIESLPPNVKVGIVVFAGAASLAQAPTQDRQALLTAIEGFQLQRHTATGSGLLLSLATLMPDSGIDVESINMASTYGARSPAIDKPKTPAKPFTPVAPGSYGSGVIILLSDGRRTIGPDPVEAAKLAADRGVRVYTVGFGSKGGGTVDFGGWSMYMVLDEEALKAVADITRAEYFFAGTAEDLKKVYSSLNSRLVMETKETELTALVTSIGSIFAVAAAALSMLWFNRIT
jgi:Ca-activated chloride channel homolog